MAMGSPMTALCLLGLLDVPVKLNGFDSKCQGWVEVCWKKGWYPVSWRSWTQKMDISQASKLCQKLHCGNALTFFDGMPESPKHITCQGAVGSFSNCSLNMVHKRDSLGVVCIEPKKTTPAPTVPPPTPTPEPTDPPRMQLLPGSWGLQCAGWVASYHGSLGGTISSKNQDRAHGLLNFICDTLQCGSFLRFLDTEATETPSSMENPVLPIRWKIENSSVSILEQPLQEAQLRDYSPALAIVCSGFQPKVQSRLAGGSGLCAGAVEVRQRGRWAALCETSKARDTVLAEEVCRQQQCGPLLSHRLLDAGDAAGPGFSCTERNLSLCHHLQDKKSKCKRVFVTCQDPNPEGLGAGTVMSIILALVLLVLLLVLCGPPAYKKLVKKYRQKKQRQWIGPTEMSQNMSFHRNHTATTTVRIQAENPPAVHTVENEYSQPPRNSQASAYPALEGTLHRVSTQPDNSSDSDYDLHITQRL
ncbi:T-cell surface glycoprotein CD5 isoform X2 [Erinaceus europaeus]|uniref:T-cell surface glycoprotein CD5 isoform X2 n=1 Tax=Erinaceus europaeus TaxID=9365 RepID=A0ABM3W6Q3_ERIEU|nr:T-cell surface glycoprotein CD5 isoform X2 [Erinaceus europaeus]